jgi:Na+/H+-dicarboxylate symporter
MTYTIEPVGTLRINAIRMTVVPLVVSLLISRIAAETPTLIGKISGRALLLFVLLVVGATLFAAAIGPPVVDRMWLDASTVTAARGTAAGSAVELPSFRHWLTGLVPANVIKAAADDAMLPLIIFTALVRFFGAITETIFVLRPFRYNPGLHSIRSAHRACPALPV